MSKTLSLFIINNVKFSKCEKLLELVRIYRDDLYIICGGVGECLELLEVLGKCYGIPNIYDDEYIVKVLKEKKFFIGGKITKVNGICIAGIDAKNPVQAVERIVLDKLDGCQVLIIISVYPLSISRCAKVVFRGREIAIGLPTVLSEKIIELTKTIPTLIISCQEHLVDLCLDTLDRNILHVSIPKLTPMFRISVDLQRFSVISMSYL